ncbi:MAG: type II toxin-antitoxin system VapC family toxin [Candidatus Diapherotrites archaeon]|nr:type II toxin-antitoxin system VapC family toxin [Candidatus Diapherotrites archaeon]
MKYLDTNIFIYALENHEKYGKACAKILQDLEDGRLKAACSFLVPIELIGAIQKLNKMNPKARQPELSPSKTLDIIFSYPLVWLDIGLFTIRHAATYSDELFGADCIHAASMELNGVREIISADADFDRLRGIKRVDPLKY